MAKYIEHVTVTTGHSRKSPKSEMRDSTIKLLQPYIKDMLKGIQRSIVDSPFACRIELNNSKMCEFIISRIEDNQDIIQFVVCRHSRHKASAWGLVGGIGNAPQTPFCAVKLITANVRAEDLQEIGMLADFERCIAWAWLYYVEGQND